MREQEQPMTQTVKASEVRSRWSQVIDQVFAGRKRPLVQRSGIPVAAIVSARDLQRLQAFEAQRERDFQALEASWEAFKDVDPSTIEQEVAAAVAAARAELREEAKKSAPKP